MSHWTSVVEPSVLIPKQQPVEPVAPAPKPRKEPKPKVTMQEHLQGRWDRSLSRKLMALLVNGAMVRKDWRQIGQGIFDQTGVTADNAVAHAFDKLVRDGFIVCEVRLTAKGREKLGLKGSP